jgi:iron complex outermembrane recepter protein
MIKSALLVTCAAAALAAAPAFAQDQAEIPATPPGAAPTTTPGEDPATSPTADAADEPTGLSQDIVVTAQGRAQVLADVPLAISAVSAASLERSGASDIRQLSQVAPSLLVSSTGNESNGSARLRGIGTVGDNPGLESSVAVFVDGVYRSRSGIGLNELGDIERVEVLRGPQGTLFGRNASAGIISIVSKAPNPNRLSAGGEVTYGNYDFWRLAGNINVPLGDTLAARVDGVWVQRDGFLEDKTNDTRVNDRDRYFLRGQLLFEPTDALSVRLIGDYTRRDEACCAAVYANQELSEYNRGLLTDTNPIIPVLKSFGQPSEAFSNPYSRNIYVSPGRSYDGRTEDWGISGQIDYDFGGAKLTSITAYRNYYNWQGGDVDYSFVDLLYRSPGEDAGRREFETFTQELRLQGSAFNDKLDWLVGGFYGNETLTTRENIKFGSQYGAYAACRLLATISPAIPRNPTAPGCRAGPGGAITDAVLGGIPIFTPAQRATFIQGLNLLSTVANVGNNGTQFRQKEENWALFTHNIVHLAEGLDLTLGLRYTNERKRLNANFANNNTICPQAQALILPALQGVTGTPQALLGGVVGLACQGNSTAELNGQSLRNNLKEDEFTGTAILSYKVTPDLLIYGSYARGYKAGGFNLDASALKAPTLPFASVGGPQALAGNLKFDPEINNAFEIGAKYSTGPFSLNVAAFRQAFDNFQLNTFNGTVFLVQNVNSCDSDLNGADNDLSAATGACDKDDVQAGVISQGVEVEATINPTRDLTVSAGFTYAKTKFRENLVGTANGAPLDPALRLLPDQYLSNAPATVVTNAVTWTPEIGNSGYSALVYVDGRLTSDYNTGSDKFLQKQQDGFFLVNARLGIRAPEQRFSIELWAQNLLDKNYTQVAFNSPYQATTSGPATGALATAFPATLYPGGTQIFSAFIAEPRTYGITLRGKF